MHIPCGETTTLKILTFEEARMRCEYNNASIAKELSASYDREKWIYIPDFYTEYRYVLGTVGKRPLITIGINPSDAEAGVLDNTLKSVERIAKGNGFDSFIMFNVYAQRSTNPDFMDKHFNKQLHYENMQAFRWLLEKTEKEPVIWAAWGTLIEKESYLKTCLSDMVAIAEPFHVKWCNAGKISVKGHPHHPLYLKMDEKLIPFDIGNYLEKM